jgi:hypothetical protein
MLDKTQDCSADQVSTPEMTSRELLNELLKADLRQVRIQLGACLRRSHTGAKKAAKRQHKATANFMAESTRPFSSRPSKARFGRLLGPF